MPDKKTCRDWEVYDSEGDEFKPKDLLLLFYSISLSVIQILHDDKVDDDGHK